MLSGRVLKRRWVVRLAGKFRADRNRPANNLLSKAAVAFRSAFSLSKSY